MEILDIYSGTNEYIGVKNRELVHKDGDWHKTFHCWIIYRNKKDEDIVILQKRSDNKKSWPGYVDISAAGHIETGETIADGIRELEEELGVFVSNQKLIDVGIRVCVEEFKQDVINHEFQSVFFLVDDRKLEEYNIQGDELSGIVESNIDDLLKLFTNQIDIVESKGLIINNGKLSESKIDITRDKFIPTLDNYYFKVMILAKRILNGEKYLHI
jgi:isopentenyldiphosphate isomerase